MTLSQVFRLSLLCMTIDDTARAAVESMKSRRSIEGICEVCVLCVLLLMLRVCGEWGIERNVRQYLSSMGSSGKRERDGRVRGRRKMDPSGMKKESEELPSRQGKGRRTAQGDSAKGQHMLQYVFCLEYPCKQASQMGR
ncbi:MAG: hypothetical protein BYD32DRAFT_413721 [Podila humilis]|nr:MAG: hypothetical protein BYD32DRAFT_413721 [Podila humilis]